MDSPALSSTEAALHVRATVDGMDDSPQTLTELRQRLGDRLHQNFSLDGERRDDTFVIEHRGSGWLVFYWERGNKRDVVKHRSQSAACHDAWLRFHQIAE